MRIGDSLNCDYRFCWLRDASLTIRAMRGLGYLDEAEGFLDCIRSAPLESLASLHREARGCAAGAR